jgi:type VI secretion system protein ImpA
MLRSAPLVRSRAFGSASLRELDAAATARGDEAAGMVASLEAVFREVELGELATAAGSVEQCDHEAASLVTVWSRRAGADASAVDFAEFRKVLAQANSVMKQRLEQRQPVLAAPASAASPAAPAASHEAFSLRGELRTREDVVKALDGVCAYYARHEPSSPVPLLVERCKRLVSMSFLEIVKDMMPDGLSAIQTIAGKQDAET